MVAAWNPGSGVALKNCVSALDEVHVIGFGLKCRSLEPTAGVEVRRRRTCTAGSRLMVTRRPEAGVAKSASNPTQHTRSAKEQERRCTPGTDLGSRRA